MTGDIVVVAVTGMAFETALATGAQNLLRTGGVIRAVAGLISSHPRHGGNTRTESRRKKGRMSFGAASVAVRVLSSTADATPALAEGQGASLPRDAVDSTPQGADHLAMNDPSIHTAYFGEIPIRFVRLGTKEAPSVYYRDFAAALRACMTGMQDSLKQTLIDGAARFMAINGDKSHRSSDNVVEPILNTFAAIDILKAIEDLRGENDESLRESGRRCHALLTWMIYAITEAQKSLGYEEFSSLVHIKDRLDKINPAFDISVFHDPTDGVWIAINDDLPIATEAASYDALIDRVWQIAPEMAVENGLREHEEDVRLYFRTVADHSISKAL